MKRLLQLVAALLVASGAAVAQEPGPSPAGYAYQLDLWERWIYGRQQPEFTPWSDPDPFSWLYIDSVSIGGAPGVRELRVSIGNPNDSRYARVVHDSAGRILDLVTHIPAPPAPPAGVRPGAIRPSRFRPGAAPDFGHPYLTVPTLIPTFDPRMLEPGAEWVDSIRLTSPERTIRGIRRSRIVKDSMVKGRRHWIVRDSATIRYVERWDEWERTLDTLVAVHRSGEGTVAGRHLYDPALRLFVTRSDTTRIIGEVELGYPDGRAFRSPARYQRRRVWQRYDRAAAETRREEVMARLRSERGGMLRLPRNALERRLREREPGLVDSLVTEWDRSRNPEERQRLHRLMNLGLASGERSSELVRLALEAGDTVFALREISRLWPSEGPLEVWQLELILPLLRDPGVALAFGMPRDPFYGNIRERLLRFPPVLFPDSSLWACTPEACELLADQYDAAGDPRLRDLALIARFVREPRPWADEIRQRAEEGSDMVHPAAQLLAGVGATWPAAAQAPLPPTGSDWRAWLEWMAGRNPDMPVASFAASTVRFERSHATAIQFVEAATGRRVIDEIERRYAEAEGDSARLVFGTILLEMGERRSSAQELAAAIRSGSDAERALALRELPRIFGSASPAEPVVASELVDRLLEVAIEGAEPWPKLHREPDTRAPRPRRVASEDAPVFILADSLPAGLADAWESRATVIDAVAWQARSDRLPSVLIRPARVLRQGPFVRLGLSYEARSARDEDERPAGYAGGMTVYLIETSQGWMQVAATAWIT